MRYKIPSNKVKRREEFRSVSLVEANVSEVPYNLPESTEKYSLKAYFIRGV
jgi:hypothetical protein